MIRFYGILLIFLFFACCGRLSLSKSITPSVVNENMQGYLHGSTVYEIADNAVKTDTSASQDNIILTCEPSNLSYPLSDNAGVWLIINNETETAYGYGYKCEVYRLENGKCLKRKLKKSDKEVLFPVLLPMREVMGKQKSERMFFSLYTNVFDYTPGTYRIKKKVVNGKTQKDTILSVDLIIE